MKKGKSKNVELDTKINYNSYYLGTYKNKTYIVDRKNKKVPQKFANVGFFL